MKIYTKTGDAGTTTLIGGHRVDKDDLRLEAYGTVDELSSFVGLLEAKISDDDDKKILLRIQSDMFVIGASLASVEERKCDVDISYIEEAIDTDQALLPELRCFILPGGCETAALAHVCRTVCRRLERQLVRLQKTVSVDSAIMAYMNRLSDYFFVLARKCNFLQKKDENTW